MFRVRILSDHLVAALAFLAAASGARAAPSSTAVTLEGHVASVVPSGDVHVREDPGTVNQNPRAATVQHENDDWEKRRNDRRTSCELTAGAVLACATNQDADSPPVCSALDHQCDFSIELPLGEPFAVAGVVFVQDQDDDGVPDGNDRLAPLIPADEGAPVCSGDVVRVDDVDVDFAEAAPSAASISKTIDTCATS